MPEPFFHAITLGGLGFLLGLKHALEADHVVAVTTFVSQTRSLRRSSLFGVAWGLGHTTTLFLAGAAVLVFRVTIPARVALSFELLVGVLLVLLGIDVLRKVATGNVHRHTRNHGGAAHPHLHINAQPQRGLRLREPASFVVGMVHGLAGSAALVLLVLATVTTVAQGLLFMAVFGAGSTLGMVLATTAVALPMKLSVRSNRLGTAVQVLAGAASVAMGVIVVYTVGIVGGLVGG